MYIIKKEVIMKKTHEVVAAVIVRNNLIFCAKRGLDKSLPNKWEFPGGKIEGKETHQEALIREVKEELSSLIEVNDYIMTVNYEYDNFKIILHSYYCTLIDGNLELSEHIDKKWIKKEELDKLDWAEADWPIVRIVKRS